MKPVGLVLLCITVLAILPACNSEILAAPRKPSTKSRNSNAAKKVLQVTIETGEKAPVPRKQQGRTSTISPKIIEQFAKVAVAKVKGMIDERQRSEPLTFYLWFKEMRRKQEQAMYANEVTNIVEQMVDTYTRHNNSLSAVNRLVPGAMMTKGGGSVQDLLNRRKPKTVKTTPSPQLESEQTVSSAEIRDMFSEIIGLTTGPSSEKLSEDEVRKLEEALAKMSSHSQEDLAKKH